MDGDRDYPMVGETVGLWRLVGGLGRGGMGEVYEAEYDFVHILTLRYSPEQRDILRGELAGLPRGEQARLAAEVLGTPLPPEARFAIKICNARTGTAGHKRFLQEAELAARLGDHPYIVSVHAVNGGLDHAAAARRVELDRGRYRDVAFMVMDLATRTWDHTRLTIGEAVHVVRCIATALDHAHAKGVVHRDLKPENILGSIEHPLLTDFGIAKEMEQDEGLTRTGQIIGTLDYMSPEQATDAKRVDHRSDIYSLGVVLYEFATGGGLPYSHKLDRDSCLSAIRSDRVSPRWPREHLPGFPVGLERIVLKAMSHRMEDRYQAMSEFITDLDRFTRGEWISPIGRVRPWDLLRFQVRYRPRLAWGSGVGAAALLCLAAWVWVVPLFDARRRLADAQLDRLEGMVADLAGGVRTQPDRDEARALDRLRRELPGLGYDDLADRLAAVEMGLLRNRRLVVAFSANQATDVQTGMMKSLELAANIPTPRWGLHADGGLRIDTDMALTLGPYGIGSTYGYLVLQAPTWEGFMMECSDDRRPPQHRLRWSVQDGMLRLIHSSRGVLREERLVGSRLGIALEAEPGGIRSWINGQPQLHRGVSGLRADSGGMWTINLTRGTVLVRCELFPDGP